MSIDELPMDVKKQYQMHVNKLKSIRDFLIDAYNNYTNIHNHYTHLSQNLTSPMFTQMNHEAVS